MSGMNFYLAQLSFGVTSSSATLSGVDSTELSADATAEIDVPVGVIQNLFNFTTDSTDIDDVTATDILYRVSYTAADPVNPLGMDIDTAATVTANPVHAGASNNNLTYDYVRYLAQELFNTHFAVDLFDNEEQLRSDLLSASKTQLNIKLLELVAEGVTDGSGNSPSKTLLSQIFNSDKQRLSNIADNYPTGDGWYKMPVLQDDKIYFVLTVAAASGQNNLTGVNSINNRTYLIKVNVVANP
jgi:hypothetical protein